MKRVPRIAALALVGVALIFFLASRAGLTGSILAHWVAEFAGWPLLCVLLLTGANLGFGTAKWLLVIRELAPGIKLSFVDSMLTTAIGALLGQLMPFQLGIALARSLAGKMGIGHSARVNLGTTMYEQMFDALVLVGAAAVSGFALVLRPTAIGWIAIALCSMLMVALFASTMLPEVMAGMARVLARMPGRISKIALGFQSALEKSAGLSPSVVLYLVVLSILRYVAIVAWVVIVLGALQMWAYAIPIIIALPLITMIGLIPVTPGNLGVAEWTWSATLLSAGATMGAAGLFALTVRIVNIVTLLILIAFLLAILLMQRVSMIWCWRDG